MQVHPTGVPLLHPELQVQVQLGTEVDLETRGMYMSLRFRRRLLGSTHRTNRLLAIAASERSWHIQVRACPARMKEKTWLRGPQKGDGQHFQILGSGIESKDFNLKRFHVHRCDG